MNVVLIGMPGAGKSRIGKALSARAGKTHVDTDRIIREKYGDIPTIFAEKGEEFFRFLESEAAVDAVSGDERVISTGGGIALKEENMSVLRKNGVIVYLKASEETLIRRTKNSSRPVLKGDAQRNIRKILEIRAPLYEKYADITVDADGDDVNKKVDFILKAIRREK